MEQVFCQLGGQRPEELLQLQARLRFRLCGAGEEVQQRVAVQGRGRVCRPRQGRLRRVDAAAALYQLRRQLPVRRVPCGALQGRQPDHQP